MQPQPSDSSFSIPMTFDYRGGRSSNLKFKIISTLAVLFITGLLMFFAVRNGSIELWQKLVFILAFAYIGLFILRFFIYNETYYSDVFEGLKKNDFMLDTTFLWQIFDIEREYPYVCYFKNGQKGVFVRMERDTIIGKSDTAMYKHYEFISDAYNVAHSLNMDITHIDYMDNIGNDSRMRQLYEDLSECENPDMQEMMIELYNSLQSDMSMNYTSYDIYLFRTRDKSSNFIYNIQTVCNSLVGGNFITYKVLNKDELSSVCKALFNLHDFSVNVACENALAMNYSTGIIPISIEHSDGSVEVLNKTTTEKKLIREEAMRRQKDRQKELELQKRKEREARRNRRNNIESSKPDDDEELDLFGDD